MTRWKNRKEERKKFEEDERDRLVLVQGELVAPPDKGDRGGRVAH